MRTGARWLLILAAVGLQNLLYFSLHYTQGWMIPWDFIGPYYALPQYWIEAAHAGVSSSWIPFQGMGYPIHLNVQSGFHYLPLQWFAWMDWPYTLTSAVVLQGLHVAFGHAHGVAAIGAAADVAADLLDAQPAQLLLVHGVSSRFRPFPAAR